jgi:hypothetical protein
MTPNTIFRKAIMKAIITTNQQTVTTNLFGPLVCMCFLFKYFEKSTSAPFHEICLVQTLNLRISYR